MTNIVNPAVAVAAQGGGKRKMHCIVLASRSDFSPVYVFPYYHEQASAFASAQEIVDAIYEDGFKNERHVFPINSPDLQGVFASRSSLSLVLADGKIREEAVEVDNTTPNKFNSYFSYDTVIEL